MTDALKPCEYHAATAPGVRIVCVESEGGTYDGCQAFCDLCGAAGPIKHDEDDAIAAWNTRAPVPVPDDVALAYREFRRLEQAADEGDEIRRAQSYADKAATLREAVRAYSGEEGVKQLKEGLSDD